MDTRIKDFIIRQFELNETDSFEITEIDYSQASKGGYLCSDSHNYTDMVVKTELNFMYEYTTQDVENKLIEIKPNDNVKQSQEDGTTVLSDMWRIDPLEYKQRSEYIIHLKEVQHIVVLDGEAGTEANNFKIVTILKLK